MEDQLISVRQAAKRLGIDRRTVYRWVQTGKLPGVKVGGILVRVRITDVDGLKQGGRMIEVREDIEQMAAEYGSLLHGDNTARIRICAKLIPELTRGLDKLFAAPSDALAAAMLEAVYKLVDEQKEGE